MSPPQILAVTVSVMVVAAFVADRLLLWMERRGWITWRRLRPHIHTSGTPLRGALASLQELVQPELRHAHEDLEQRSAARADTDSATAPADPSGGRA